MALRRRQEKKKEKKKKTRMTRARAKTYTRLSAFLPRRVIRKYEQMMVYADIQDVDPRVYVGFSLTFSIFAGIIAFFACYYIGLEVLWCFVTTLCVSVILAFLFYFNLVMQADARAKNIEKILPDALQLVSANIRAGMTIDISLWLTAKPEFGAFEVELRRMAAQTLGGKPLQIALEDSGKRVRSTVYQRALKLIVQGIQLGGRLADLLTEISIDIRQTQALEREIQAATTMYMIFIIFASVFAAPALFAVSTFYVEVTSELWVGEVGSGLEDVGQGVGVGVFQLGQQGMTITPEEIRLFALASIIITTFFGALILGLIREGKAKRGARYIPAFMITALGIYFAVYYVIKGMLGGLIAV